MGLSLDEPAETFSHTIADLNAQRLQGEAVHDLKNMALTTLGLGAGARGLMGLHHLLAGRYHRPRSKVGPSVLELPFPAVQDETAAKEAAVTMKTSLPWYRPAMVMTGLAGLGAGWKGLDAILDRRRKQEDEADLDAARGEFQDALLSQYDTPRESPHKEASAASPMRQAGQALDRAFATLERVAVKEAMTLDDLTGQAAGLYGTYALPTALLTGMFTYNKLKGRSRHAVLEKALKQRAMSRFQQSPPPIYIAPSPQRVPGQDEDAA